MEKNKMRRYEAPTVDVVVIGNSDVITTSAGDPRFGDTPIWDLTW